MTTVYESLWDKITEKWYDYFDTFSYIHYYLLDFAFVWRGDRLFNQNMNMNCLGLPKRTVCVFLWDTKNTKGFSNNSYYQNKVAQILVMQPFWSN